MAEFWQSGIVRVLRRVGYSVTFPVRLLLTLSKATLATLCLVLMVTSFVAPILATTSRAVFVVAAKIAEAVTTIPSVLKRQEVAASARLAEKEALIAAEMAAKKSAQRAAADAVVKLDKATTRALTAERQTADLATKLESKEIALSEMVGAKVLYRGKQRAIKEVVAEAANNVGKIATKTIKVDISGMVGQSIPYMGAVAVVGVTTFDVVQSCELMTELHELDVAFNPDHAIDAREVCGMQVPTLDEILVKAKAAPDHAIDAIVENIPEFQWEAGWRDLSESLPKFYWTEGWNDLLQTFKGPAQ